MRKEVEEQTREEIRQTIDALLPHAVSMFHMQMHTSKPGKTAALKEYIHAVSGVDLAIRSVNIDADEPDHPSSRHVSLLKARMGKRLAGEEQRREATVFAGDTNFFVFRNGWQQWRKLERLGRTLSEEEIVRLYQDLHELFVAGKDHFHLCWDVSMSGVNGREHSLSEWIYVEANPVPRELFDAFFLDALKSGILYTSNARLACIEMLIASGSITKVSVVPYGSEVQGDLLAPALARTMNKDLGAILTHDIRASIPSAAFLGW